MKIKGNKTMTNEELIEAYEADTNCPSKREPFEAEYEHHYHEIMSAVDRYDGYGDNDDAVAEAEYQEMKRIIVNTDDRKSFALAGNARFTLDNPLSGNRFTYRVRVKETDDGRTLHFVSVLTGSDNESDYTFLGTIFDGATFRHGRKSRISETAPSAKAFAWAWRRIYAGASIGPAVFMHEGRCGRCGRALTVPESIKTGLGPVCAEKE